MVFGTEVTLGLSYCVRGSSAIVRSEGIPSGTSSQTLNLAYFSDFHQGTSTVASVVNLGRPCMQVYHAEVQLCLQHIGRDAERRVCLRQLRLAVFAVTLPAMLIGHLRFQLYFPIRSVLCSHCLYRHFFTLPNADYAYMRVGQPPLSCYF